MKLISSIAMGLVMLLPGCKTPPPFVAYMTAGIYRDGKCGYDWNGRGIFLKDAKKEAKEWDDKEVAVLFRFGDIPDSCAKPAYNALRDAGFERIWVVHRPYPEVGGPLLVPYGKSSWF